VTERLTAVLSDRYQIERELGAGGMATVYLAYDIKHNRKVAIKVLKPELAAVLGAERFVVEIKTTAALQHPHILPLFDSGEADGLLYYVMPYIQGETIREKLNRETQFGVDDAVRVAREVADALDYAHRQGVIHRDIKPENILLHDGRAMVMDFGIALAVSAAAGGRMTETGLSLGTPHYMSPEQATAEREITARSDVYSLASVLYEMLAGDPPFTASSAQAVIMKIITEPAPPVTVRRKTVPSNVSAAVGRALEKLPADRFESAKAFSDALGNPGFVTSSVAASGRTSSGARSRTVSYTAFAAACGIAIVATVVALWARRGESASPSPLVPLTLEQPQGNPDLLHFAVSPDGSRFAFSTDDGIVVRDAGQRSYRVLPGTQRGEAPSFSPDGEWIAFQIRGRLRKVAVRGGSSESIVARDSAVSGAMQWGPNGAIIFESGGGLSLIPAGSAVPNLLRHAHSASSPTFTPDGRGVLYLQLQQGSSLMYYDLSKDTAYTVLDESAGAQLLPNGILLSTPASGGVVAMRFDQSRHSISGTPEVVVTDIQPTAGASPFVVTTGGTLVYRAGVDPAARLRMRDANGRLDTLPVAPQQFAYTRFSPDGTKLAVTIGAARVAGRYTSIYDFAFGSLMQFTVDGGAHSPIWSPDGRRLAFTAEAANTDAEDLFVQPVDKSAPPLQLVRLPTDQHATSWPTDTMLVFSSQSAPVTLGTRNAFAGRGPVPNVSIVNPSAPGKSRAYLQADWTQSETAVSPDGKLAAFTSTESGTEEVMVRHFPAADSNGQWKLSSAGGRRPRWSGDGRTIFYQTLDGKNIKAAHVTTGSGFAVGSTETVFSTSALGNAWDVDWRTGKMVFAEPIGDNVPRIIVIQNWLANFMRNRK